MYGSVPGSQVRQDGRERTRHPSRALPMTRNWDVAKFPIVGFFVEKMGFQLGVDRSFAENYAVGNWALGPYKAQNLI